MKCDVCDGRNFADGTIEGVNFSPLSELHKSIGRGAYGISIRVCLDCGVLFDWCLAPGALKVLHKIVGSEKVGPVAHPLGGFLT